MAKLELVKFDEETESAYILFVEPNKYAFYTEVLPENTDIMLDLGKEIPVVGIELAGDLGLKVAKLPEEQKHFVKTVDSYGNKFYSFRFSEKEIVHSISYERIVEVKFLFANNECTDLIGIDVYSENPNYLFVQVEDNLPKGMIKKLIGKLLT